MGCVVDVQVDGAGNERCDAIRWPITEEVLCMTILTIAQQSFYIGEVVTRVFVQQHFRAQSFVAVTRVTVQQHFSYQMSSIAATLIDACNFSCTGAITHFVNDECLPQRMDVPCEVAMKLTGAPS